MNVLSLFDGISAGRVAFDRAGIKVNKYYASEIDKYAIKISESNYPDIIRLGDIKNWQSWPIDWASIDLLIGGSPCQGFSLAGKQLAFDDPRSRLFFIYVDILNHIESVNPKIKFMLENVRMKKEHLSVITDCLGVNPVVINSALVSAQNRVRYYWVGKGITSDSQGNRESPVLGKTRINIDIAQPEDKNIYLADIIESGITDRDKSLCLDANYFKGGNLKSYFEKHRRQLIFSSNETYNVACGAKRGRYVIDENQSTKKTTQMLELRKDGKTNTITTVQKDNYLVFLSSYQNKQKESIKQGFRKLTTVECERLQTLTDNYTMDVSNTQRYRALGNSWTVDIIAHIFRILK